MTHTCPPDAELEQLLAGQMSAAEKQAVELHVAGCAACQFRLVQLNQGGQTLPGRPAGPERGPLRSSTDAAPPSAGKDTASPAAAGSPRRPATETQWTTNFTPNPAADPPTVP